MTRDLHLFGPLVGNLWVPVWAVRPGSYAALARLADSMPLWLLLHSRNGDYLRPCYASREKLGQTLGIGRAKVSRQLSKLRKAALVFEVRRGMQPKTQRHRPPARWALDPFTADRWREGVETSLARVAQEDPQSRQWRARALTSLDALDRRSRQLRARIAEDMPLRLLRKCKRKPRRRKPKTEPGSKMSPGSDLSLEGMGGGRGEEGRGWSLMGRRAGVSE